MQRAAFILLVCFLGSLAAPGAPARPTSFLFYLQDNGAPPQDQGGNTSYEPYTPEQLDNLLSPIALYPDPLLAQVMVAATFPDQIEEAARWVRANGQNGIDNQNWDVSVKSVAHYPSVVEMMADKLDWTTAIGQAYVNQSTDVSTAIQRLRHQARTAGNLESTPQQEVVLHDDYIGIYPYQPQYLYVPVYDPAIIYFRRPYWGPAIYFGSGFLVGAWLNLGWHWGGPGIYYTGWRHEGWYGGWVDRYRGSIHINNVYVNNRYTNVNINRTVVNRTVNVNNINRYNSIHRNVTYNNVQNNNQRIDRANGGNGRQATNGIGNNGRPGANNKIMDRNIDRSNPRIDQYRGRETNARSDRPPSAARPTVGEARPSNTQNRPGNGQPSRPAVQPAARPGPHTFNRTEGNFDPRVSSQRGQSSRAQVQQNRPAQPARSNAQPHAQPSHAAPAPHGGKKP